MNTHIRRLLSHALTASMLFMVGVGCVGEGADSPDDQSAARGELDNELVCPDGQIPWSFPASGRDAFSEGNQTDFSRITVSKVSCGDASLDASARVERAKQLCDGKRICDIATVCQDSCAAGPDSAGCSFSGASIEYSCGDSDVDSDGDLNVYTSSARSDSSNTLGTGNALSCEGRGEASASSLDFAEVAITGVTCAEGSLQDPQQIELAKRACDGQRACTLRSLCSRNCADPSSPLCTYSDATVTYTCSTDAGGTSEVQTAAADKNNEGTYATFNTIDCKPLEKNDKVETSNDGATVCVPAECHGRTSRNADMQCVVDASKLEVVVDATIGELKPAREIQDSFSKEIIAREVAKGLLPGVPMSITGTYTIPITVTFANDLVPEEVKFTAWIEDEYIDGVYGPLIQGENKRFRCNAFAFTLEKDDPHTEGSDGTRTYTKTITTKFADDCASGAVKAEFAELIKERSKNSTDIAVGDLKGSDLLDRYLFQRLHLSYDMAGRTVWHKNLSLGDADKLGESEPECAPNPLKMFYDRAFKTFNRRAYFSQRLLTTYEPPSGRLFFGSNYSDRAEIGTVDIVARNSPTIRVFSNRSPSLITDISWYVSNMDHDHLLNFENPRMIGSRMGLNTPRADVYVVPSSWSRAAREEQPPLFLGSVELTDGKANGVLEGTDDQVTQSVALRLSKPTQNKLSTDESSLFYIPGRVGSFDLFYCINAVDGNSPLKVPDAYAPLWSDLKGKGRTYRHELRWLENPQIGDDGKPYDMVNSYSLIWDGINEAEGNPVNPVNDSGPFKQVWSVELENASMHDPNATPFKYRGCRTAKAPLLVYVDRFKTPTEPTERIPSDIPASARNHTDFTENQKSGDSSMSGNNDLGVQETCADGNSKGAYCSNSSKSGGRSKGESGRSTLDMDLMMEHDPPSEGSDFASVTMKFRGEMASFGALDLSASSASNPSRSFMVNLAPNWENIASALNGGSPSLNSEWLVGKYGEEDGLGFALGYRIMFQIGPVPVFAQIKFAVGASVGIGITFDFAASTPFECTGKSEDCTIVKTSQASFADASKACSNAGGRLAELQDAAEAQRLKDAMAASNVPAVWLGAQIAHEETDDINEYRWLSDNKAFATDEGGVWAYFNNIRLSTRNDLPTFEGREAAVTFNPSNDTVSAKPVASSMPYACTLPHADEEIYFGWSSALSLGVGAGVGIEGCTPAPGGGLCLSVNLNIINATVTPTVGQTFRWLLRNGEAFARNGLFTFSIPLTITLFSGDIRAALKIPLLFFDLTLEWIIHSFSGFELLKVDLYKLEIPLLEDY